MRIGLQVPSFTWPGGASEIGSRLANIARTAEEGPGHGDGSEGCGCGWCEYGRGVKRTRLRAGVVQVAFRNARPSAPGRAAPRTGHVIGRHTADTAIDTRFRGNAPVSCSKQGQSGRSADTDPTHAATAAGA